MQLTYIKDLYLPNFSQLFMDETCIGTLELLPHGSYEAKSLFLPRFRRKAEFTSQEVAEKFLTQAYKRTAKPMTSNNGGVKMKLPKIVFMKRSALITDNYNFDDSIFFLDESEAEQSFRDNYELTDLNNKQK